MTTTTATTATATTTHEPTPEFIDYSAFAPDPESAARGEKWVAMLETEPAHPGF